MIELATMESENRKCVFDVEKVRKDFPMLFAAPDSDRPIIYLDNAATTYKPWSVISRMVGFESGEYAAVRNNSYKMGEAATMEYEYVREKTADFIGTDNPSSIIFTSGATHAINLVAHSFGKRFIGEGDEIIISGMERHANIIPWQTVRDERGARIKVIPVSDQGELLVDELERLLSPRTKIVAVTHVSNVLGVVNQVKTITELAHSMGARVLVDGALAAPHLPVNVTEIDCDFYVFSSHKMYGPTGLGVLYGKPELLAEMPPYITGGGVSASVTFEKTIFASSPAKFEAGTPPLTQVMGFGEAIKYIEKIGPTNIFNYESALLKYATFLLERIPQVKIIGSAARRAAVLSFTVDGAHPHDVARLLDQNGIAVGGGRYCAHPIMERFGVPATLRASFGLYNRLADAEALAESVLKVTKPLS